MSENNILSAMATLEEVISPQDDINTREARFLMRVSQTQMEMVGNSYLYGYLRGQQNEAEKSRKIPLYNIRQMTDDEWNHLAAQNKAERQVLHGETNYL